MLDGFNPNWEPPSVVCTIDDILEKRNIIKSQWLLKADISDEEYFDILINGTQEITEEFAKKLVNSLGVTTDFWIRRWKLWKYGWTYDR